MGPNNQAPLAIQIQTTPLLDWESISSPDWLPPVPGPDEGQ